MRNRKFLLSDQKVYAILLFFLLILQFYSNFNISNSNVDGKVIFITSIAAIVMFLKNFRVIGSLWNLILIMITILSLIITVIMHTGTGSALLTFNLILFILIFNNIQVSTFFYKAMHLFCAIGLTYYLLQINMNTSYTTIVQDKFGNLLNTNVVALWTLASFLHWVCYLDTVKLNKYIKIILYILISFLSGYYIFMCNSRTAILSIFAFWILSFLLKKSIKRTTFRIVTMVILAISVILPIIYLILFKYLSNFMLFGKNFFSGRQLVWQSVIDLIKEYPVFGSGNDFLLTNVDRSYTASAHNMLLGLIKMFGFLPAFSIFIYFVNNNANKSLGERNRISQIAFLSSLICCFFESFYTYSHLYLFFLLFLLSFIKSDSESAIDTVS